MISLSRHATQRTLGHSFTIYRMVVVVVVPAEDESGVERETNNTFKSSEFEFYFCSLDIKSMI